MKVAIPFENGQIFQHFGHTSQFKIYDIKDEKIIAEQIVDAQGHGHGVLAQFLQNLKVDTLICGGIGVGAVNALQKAGILLYIGVSISADDAICELIKGNLYSTNASSCSHADHNCDEHSCGKHGSSENVHRC